MCLNCGCMRAHDTMGKPDNITYEVVKQAADANGMTVPATLAIIATTAARDRRDHPAEYLSPPDPAQQRGLRLSRQPAESARLTGAAV